jgi:ubiquinone/menaquinone biosynthesis C-methylase UbiE
VYVAADIYRLPFVHGLFDAATMIRTLHHMADAPRALAGVRDALAPGATFVLEFANKLNESHLALLAGRRAWSPFDLAPVEFAELISISSAPYETGWLTWASRGKNLTVSHFRIGLGAWRRQPRWSSWTR